MNITPWNSLRGIHELQRRAFGHPGHESRCRPGRSRCGTDAADWAPPADIAEDAKEFLIQLDLPGVPRDQVRVTVDGGRLRISGERTFEKTEDGPQYHRVERRYGAFKRSFRLPENTDPSQVSAEFKDGVLFLRISKREGDQSQEVEVKVS